MAVAYAAALALFEVVGDRVGQVNVLQAHGDLRRTESGLAGAAADYAASLALFEVVGDRVGQAKVFQAHGDLERAAGRLLEAHGPYLSALSLDEQTGSRLGQSDGLAELAQVFALAGDAAQVAEVHNPSTIELVEHVLAWVEEAMRRREDGIWWGSSAMRSATCGPPNEGERSWRRREPKSRAPRRPTPTLP
ncbi:hypothetical protein L6R49_05285 [Myxococcota bacterium]|nr:hypothetical protein [Myxococcota bacterium]